jgi:CheY-like chemotaxis protein
LINQKLLVKILSNLNCQTAVASDGQDCVNLLLNLVDARPPERYFDLILMDLEMPILDGMEATKQIRMLEAEHRLPNAIPIIAVSGNARSEHAERAVCLSCYIVTTACVLISAL